MKKLGIGLIVPFFILLAFNSAVGAPKKSRFEKLELFNKVLFLIESQYYRQVDTEKLIEGAIKGMMNTLDPHSAYLDDRVFSKMQEDTSGEFGGLGIEVSQKEGVLIVTTPIEDTPAFEAGIKPGDKIVEINHESTAGITLEEAVQKMRGKPGSKITIGVSREGVDGVKQFTIKRKVIKVSSVKSKLLEDEFIYIRLTQFQKNSTKQVVKAIKKIRKKAKGKDKGIVLDLRFNPGGLLDEAVNLSSVFLKDGIVVSTEGRDPKQKEIRYVKKTGHKELKTPLVVLINGASASASEIVAGALQDKKRALVVGSQSFGKGSVQSVAKISESQGLKLTIAQYMTPSGKKIQAVGIKPDIHIGEFESEWAEENSQDSPFVRERDLKNHLTATIETPEEKKAREKKEREERKQRIEKYKKLKQAKKSKKKKVKGPYDPAKDYQVRQAINYLRSYIFSKKM